MKTVNPSSSWRFRGSLILAQPRAGPGTARRPSYPTCSPFPPLLPPLHSQSSPSSQAHTTTFHHDAWTICRACARVCFWWRSQWTTRRRRTTARCRGKRSNRRRNRHRSGQEVTRLHHPTMLCHRSRRGQRLWTSPDHLHLIKINKDRFSSRINSTQPMRPLRRRFHLLVLR